MKRREPPSSVTSSSVMQEPLRLIDESSGVAELLRSERDRLLGPGVPFEQLMARSRPRKLRSGLVWGAVAAATLSCLGLSHLMSEDLDILPEPRAPATSRMSSAFDSSPQAKEPRPVVVESTPPDQQTAPKEDPPERRKPAILPLEDPVGTSEGRNSAPDRPLPDRPLPDRPLPERASSMTSPSRPELAGPTQVTVVQPRAAALDCGASSRQGAFEAALDCYDQRASGEGVGAELALLEGARIAWKALHSPQRALQRLTRYERRFEFGALRREAILLKVEVLHSSGDLAAALVVIEKAIDRVPERATELRKQAFDIAVRLGNCELAHGNARALLRAGVEEGLIEASLADCKRNRVQPDMAGAAPVR